MNSANRFPDAVEVLWTAAPVVEPG